MSTLFNIVLYQPQIPPNTGNIARLCVGTNAKLHLIRPIAFFLDDKSMKRAGCDYWDHLDLECHDTINDLIQSNSNSNFYFITKHGKKRYNEANFKKGDFLVFGSEQRGLPDELLEKYAGQTLRIPMNDKIRSINLANSVAIVLYEGMRQQFVSEL